MDDNEQLTADEQAALDSQRNTPEPEAQPSPEAPQEGATEAEAPEGTEQPPADKRPQMVPHAALHEERERRKEVERQAAEDRRKYEARFEKMMEALHPPAQPEAKPAEPPLPDFQQDPAGYIVANMQRQGATLEQTQQALTELRAQQQQQQVVAAVQQRAAAMEADYRAQNPEYDGAMNYLRQFRARQLQAAGWSDQAQIAQQISAEAFQIAASALQQGGNPAERLHKLAEASGWAKPNGEQPAVDAVAQAGGTAPDQAARLQMVQRGQEHARSLGNVRGNGPSPMTAAKLLDIPDENFDEIIKVMRSPAAKKLMGA